MASKSSITIRVSVEGDNGPFVLEDIPETAWKQFEEKAKAHFPKSQDPWASAITEFIIALGGGDGNRRTFIMTDVPNDMAKAMDDKLAEVDWTWDRLHAYLLKAVSADQLKIIAMQSSPQNFGTVLITGIDPDMFDRMQKLHPNLTVERYMGTLIPMLTYGELSIDPETKFAEPINKS